MSLLQIGPNRGKNSKHGWHGTPTYAIWGAMIQRCGNPKAQEYHRYGGRGIKVCERWLRFEHFLADMGLRPDGLTIDRKNNDRDYCPENCRWATRREQQQNTIQNRNFTFNGETLCISEWARRMGFTKKILRDRLIKLGWGVQKALTTPPQQRHIRNGTDTISVGKDPIAV